MNWYLSSGDLDFFWKEQIQHLSWIPNVFRTDVGFGWSGIMSLWLDYPFRLVLKLLSAIGLSWFFIEKLLWMAVFIIAAYSSYCLAKYILKSRLSSWLASFIYIANTYFLLLFSGGQLGVALAYAFAPFVLFRFIESLDTKKPTIKKAITNGLWLTLLIIFDLRLAYLAFGVIFLYQIISRRFHIRSTSISVLVAMAVHAFWILPTIMTQTGPSVMGEDFTNPGMLRFLSFADFSHTISLLHPNWPENLFGKVYFLQPEFLLIPLVAFCSLLFITQAKNKKHILFLGLLVLIGAFFAKGTQPPFGGIFTWCFQHIPGFIMFRDPTKFYMLTAIGYSVLIPFTLSKINKYFVYALFGVFWLILLRAVATGEVKGNFQPIQLPQEYVQLKDQLVQDTKSSRTLWIPNKENFAYYSDIHPVLQMNQLFKDMSLSELATVATSSAFLETLNNAGVKYVIVPMNIEGKIFMRDYKYNNDLRMSIVNALKSTPLKQNANYVDIAVFENPQFQDMKITVPDIVQTQQYYANVGVLISVVVFIVIVIFIVWF